MFPILEIVAIASVLVVSANFIQGFLVRKLNPDSTFEKVLALGTSSLVAVATRFLGYDVLVGILKVFSPETAFPPLPGFPEPFTFVNWILTIAFTWALSGGAIKFYRR